MIATVSRFSGTRPGEVSLLTPAETRVCALLVQGHANKEIAAALGRSEATVKHQVSACLRKFGQPSRARLIATLRWGQPFPLPPVSCAARR